MMSTGQRKFWSILVKANRLGLGLEKGSELVLASGLGLALGLGFLVAGTGL
jgi:hypothetical protein